ncbi:MAG: 50S ribosomal protein L15 [Candidatus Paceibacterota bacterium]|jgi:large subunit ribosomal protein L15|nr:50S ribosomal protein L15 [Candidatus Paceibacterota bacterium]
MQIHELSPKHKQKRSKRIGRGGKKGTYSGKGMKGQKSRAGRKMKPAIRSLIKRYPKLRGYSFNPLKVKPAIVNTKTIEKKFKEGEVVSPKALLEKKLVRRMKGREPIVKILGDGKLSKAFTFEGCIVSKKAKAVIEKAGGEVK